MRAHQAQYAPRQVAPQGMKPVAKPRQSLVSQNPNGTLRRDGNEYACILEMPLPPPPVSPGEPKMVTPGNYDYNTNNIVDPIPYTTQYDASISSQDDIRYPDDPRYFELDPEGLPTDGTHAHGLPQDIHMFNMAGHGGKMERSYDPSRYPH